MSALKTWILFVAVVFWVVGCSDDSNPHAVSIDDIGDTGSSASSGGSSGSKSNGSSGSAKPGSSAAPIVINGGKDTIYVADAEGSLVLPISAKLESDIAELDDPEEKAMFMEELGLKESGLDRLIRASYELLGLISFLTGGGDECRAWTIRKGTKAPQAAGKIHTDFERGFIRAEVIAFDDLKACGTLQAAKAKGLVRSEGKEYVMRDGDVVNFLFNV